MDEFPTLGAAKASGAWSRGGSRVAGAWSRGGGAVDSAPHVAEPVRGGGRGGRGGSPWGRGRGAGATPAEPRETAGSAVAVEGGRGRGQGLGRGGVSPRTRPEGDGAVDSPRHDDRRGRGGGRGRGGRAHGGGGRAGDSHHDGDDDEVSTSPFRKWVVHCKKKPFDVYIGRPNPTIKNSDFRWGNPFKIGEHGTRADVISSYREWLFRQPALMEDARRDLRGKVLACWCSPLACHGDVLAEVANAVEEGREDSPAAAPSDVWAGMDEPLSEADLAAVAMDGDEVSTSPFRHMVVHCKKAKYDVYIGRPNPSVPDPGIWGNPFKQDGKNTKRQRIAAYRRWLLSDPARVARAKRELGGKVLACWCSPLGCHGDVLAEVANS